MGKSGHGRILFDGNNGVIKSATWPLDGMYIDIDNGIIKIEQKDNADVYIEMTVTSPMCPVAGVLPQQAADAVAGIKGVGEVEVKIVWEPAWSLANLSDEAKEMFELL